MACAPIEDSDQPGHPPSLIRVFAVRMKKAWVLSYPLSTLGRLWSDWADVQTDLRRRWAHRSFWSIPMDAKHSLYWSPILSLSVSSDRKLYNITHSLRLFSNFLFATSDKTYKLFHQELRQWEHPLFSLPSSPAHSLSSLPSYDLKYHYLSQRMTKHTKWNVHQTKTQRPVQSDQSSLSAWRCFGSLATHRHDQSRSMTKPT